VIPLNPKRPDRRLLAVAIGTVAAFGLVSCGPSGPSPTKAPQGAGSSSSQSASIPRPDQATIALGSSGPGYDGSSDFLSFASTLAPARAMTDYVNQLLGAGYRDAGRQGAWRVFVDPTMTVWVRVGAAGPPTNLVVRFARNDVALLDGPTARQSLGAPASADGSVTGPQPVGTATRPNPNPGRRPDPPHAAGQAGTGKPAGGGTATAGPTKNAGPAAGGLGRDSSGGGTGARP
jgi:hypothetical protein